MTSGQHQPVSPDSMDCYVYFKTPQAQSAQVLQEQALWQQAIAAQLGYQGKLQRRPEIRDGLQTWMEVYRDVPPDFPARLSALLASQPLPLLNSVPRHQELFVDC